jgi:hypothetical protein
METEMEQNRDRAFPGHKGQWAAHGDPGETPLHDHDHPWMHPDDKPAAPEPPHDPDTDVLTNAPPANVQ